MKTVDFSETIAASDLKVSRSIHLIEYMKIYRKMENFRVVQFSSNFAVGRDPRKLKATKYIPSLSKAKAILHKRTKIRFCSSHFLYVNQTKTQV